MPRQNLTAEDKRRIDELCARMEALAARHSQAEISRRTGASPANVSRYLRGTRIPMDFGVALIEALDVNPTWLMTGQGAPNLADINAGTTVVAGDLLELVKAMGAAERVKLGAVAGKHHLRVLRELGEALRGFEELRARLDRRVEPTFQSLIEQCSDALGRKRFTEAGDLLKTLERIAPLCHDEELQDAYQHCRAVYLSFSGEHDEAIAIQQRLFRNALARASSLTAELTQEARNLVGALLFAGRAREARTVARLALAIHDESDDPTQRHLLECTLVSTELALGDLSGAFARFMRHHTQLPSDQRQVHSATYARLLFLSGNADWNEIASLKLLDHPSRDFVLLPFALWTEDQEVLEDACRLCIGTRQGFPADSDMGALALLARDILRGRSAKWRDHIERDKSSGRNPNRLLHLVAPPWLARLAGDLEAAWSLLPDVVRYVNSIPPDRTEPFVPLAIHHRNVLLLVPPTEKTRLLAEARKRAERFFRDHVAAGFNLFRPTLELV